jgi:hypothetical protein
MQEINCSTSLDLPLGAFSEILAERRASMYVLQLNVIIHFHYERASDAVELKKG